jgi:hypothetical protein
VSARGWVERLSGARASSATQQPSSRARQGAGNPAHSGNPERIPAPPPGPRARPPVPDPKGSALPVVLVSRDKMLAGALRSLIEAPGGVRVLDWDSEELDAAIRHADVVIVDMPPNLHERTFAVIDGRFLGRTVVLLQEGEHAEALPPGPPRAILYRPVQIGELWMAVTGATPPASDPPAPGREGMPDAAPEPVDAGSVGPPEPQEPEAPEPEPPAEPEQQAVTADEAATTEVEVEEAPAAEAEPEVDDQEPAPEEAVEATDGPAAAVEPRGLPVAESGRLIGLSGQELDPVIGPGQVAPGMDEATLQRLRGWGSQGREPAAGRTGPTPATHPTTGREEARWADGAQAEARRAERAAADQAKAAEAEAEGRREQSARAQAARAAAREEARQAKAARVAARQQAGQARAAKAETRRVGRKARAEEARQAKAAEAEARRIAREARAEEARQAKAGAEAHRAAQKAGAEEARKARAAQAEAERVAREAKAEQARRAKVVKAEAERVAGEAKADQERREKAAKAEARAAAREEARRARMARTGARQAARSEARQARAARAEERRAARAEAKQARAARVKERRAARAEAAQQRAARAAARGRIGWGIRTAVIVLAMAAVGLAAAGWRGGGGPDTLAGEVAAVRAAGGSGGGLVVQDPRVGPIEPLHALAVGAWLRATEAEGSLEGAIREARVPSRFLLAGLDVLSVPVLLLLMRVGPGTGAAAGPGPAPPHTSELEDTRRWWRLGAAAVAGALVALDPVLVRGGRTATGTVLAVVLALGALALAWGVPTRPALRWLPLVAAVGGLALLASPLALPFLAVPVVAELLEGRHREAWRDMAALGLGIGLWLALPIWVAGQGLDAGQAWWLLGRPSGRGAISASLADAPLTWLLVAAGLAAAILPWRHRSGARSDPPSAAARLVAWTATTAAGAVVAVALGYPADQALPFAVPAAAVALAAAGGSVRARRTREEPRRPAGGAPRLVGVAAGLALAGLLVAQGVDWGARYRPTADDGLARLMATVKDRVPGCSAVNAGGPDDRARLLATGATVTGFSDGPAAQAAGVRYFVLTGATARGGPQTPALAGWVRQHGTRLAVYPSRTLSGLELWQVDAPPLDPVADSLPVPDGVFSNVDGSGCGGYRVVNSQVGSFYTAYQAVGGKAVLGRPLGSVWTSDGPALQAFDTMVLGAVPASSGPPAVAPIELPPLLAKLDVEAVADADIPLPSARPPVTDRQVQALLKDKTIARAYLGADPATASAADRRRARARFGRPLGLPQVMPDGAVRQTFERVVLELPADGGPARPAALGRLAVRLGLVPKQATRLEPVPGLPTRPASTRLDTGPMLRLVGGGLLLLALAAGAGAVTARRSRTTDSG